LSSVAGDLYHLRDNREFRRLPGFNYSRAEPLVSIDRRGATELVRTNNDAAVHSTIQRILSEDRKTCGSHRVELLRVQFHQDLPHIARGPAMAASVTDRLWDASDLVSLLEAEEREERAA
jgi:hypothetical protein